MLFLVQRERGRERESNKLPLPFIRWTKH